MTAKMSMMRYYISLQGFINYLEQQCMVQLMDPFHSTMVMSVLCRGVPQWILWASYGNPLQCCMCFYRDQNYLQPILNPGGYLPLHSGCSTVLLSDKKKSCYSVEY